VEVKSSPSADSKSQQITVSSILTIQEQTNDISFHKQMKHKRVSICEVRNARYIYISTNIKDAVFWDVTPKSGAVLSSDKC
jgi:hypothetical protein